MIGKTISHYKIIEKIGGGGMGEVYKAEDTKLNRTVALKFLPPTFALDDEFKHRFILEAQAASSLQHNNICTIHDIDETNEGQLFYCMDLYTGETLKKKIEQEQLSIDEVINIAIQTAEGLAKAHEKNITHRDIKPANIFITNEDVVKILDFGIAKVSGQTQYTQMGRSVGTTAYMSPEQTMGDMVDLRSDIWSLGVMMYEMVSGKLPFKAEYDQAAVYAIRHDDPKPLEIESYRELQAIISKCIEKNPEDRYKNVNDLLADLNKLKDRSSISQIGRITNKKIFQYFIIAAAVFIIFIIGFNFIPNNIFDITSDTASNWENSIAVLPFENLSNDPEQEYFCEGMTEQIISNLSKLPKLKVIARQSMRKYKNSDKTISEIGNELNVAYVLESSIRMSGENIRITTQLIDAENDFHLWTENYEKEYKELFALQDEISENLASNLFKTISGEDLERIKSDHPNNLEAWEYYIKGQYNYQKYILTMENIEYLKNAEEMWLKSLELDPKFVPLYATLVDLYNTYLLFIAKEEDEKQKYFNLMEQYVNAGFEIDSQSAEMYVVKGWLFWNKGDLEGEFECYKKSYNIDPNNYRVNHNLGVIYFEYGLDNLAIKYFTRLFELDPNTNDWEALIRLSTSYIRTDDLKQAEFFILKTRELNPESRWAKWQHSQILILAERIDEAKNILKELEIPSGKRHDFSGLASGMLYALEGEKEKALQNYQKGDPWRMTLYNILKMNDESIEFLNKKLEQHRTSIESFPNYLTLKNSRNYDFLRSDSRFQEILREEKKIYDKILAKYIITEL